MRKKKFAAVRHAFLYKWEDPSGKLRQIKAWAKVRHPTRAVTLTVKPEHVERSMRLDGVGNTANCSMAVCAVDSASSFPHKVEGHIDWTYTRAFVVSKTNKDGLPTECYVYDHWDEIARLNDTQSGQQKLLKRLKEEGPRQITLTPKRVRSKKGRSGAHRPRTGTRSPELRGKRGGRLRYATAHLASQGADT